MQNRPIEKREFAEKRGPCFPSFQPVFARDLFFYSLVSKQYYVAHIRVCKQARNGNNAGYIWMRGGKEGHLRRHLRGVVARLA